MKSLSLSAMLLLIALAVIACFPPGAPPAPAAPAAPADEATLDRALRQALTEQGISTLDPGPMPDPAKAALGQLLFFDKELSGNRDTSCATCHQPNLGTGDELPLAVGTGGSGMAPDRLRGAMRMMVPRNATELFNRSAPEWRTMFWDGRLRTAEDGSFIHPVEFDQPLPEGLDNILAAQAMFPITSRAEMRGNPKDFDIQGLINEVGSTGEYDLNAVWRALIGRLVAIPEYVELFAAAYPDVPTEELGFQHAANALAAFQIDAFTLLDSPWDRYLAGDDGALTEKAKQGALLFYGEAGCAECHSGNLLTDQQFYNIATPQFGPGKGRANAYVDLGHARETGNPDDRFAFRTPPLRNVTLTGPWMHNGAYSSLEDAVRHHLDPGEWCEQYDYGQLPADIRSDLVVKPAVMEEMVESIDPLVAEAPTLTDAEIGQIMAFMEALTDPAAADLSHVIPESVPSGLPVPDNILEPTAFVHSSQAAGITAKHTQGYQVTGQAWADYDGDGWLDLYVTDSVGPNTLYRNNGDGAFSVSPLNDQVALPDHYSGGASWADYDNDGWPDLLVLGREADLLFHNDGGQGFSDVTAEAGVGDTYASKTASWADYDNDGWLDLYVANWGCVPRCARTPGSTGEPDQLYRNNGDGAFSNVSALLGGKNGGGGFVARWLDYDNDGDLDIYLVNDEFILPPGNKLFRNDGPGCGGWCFSEVAEQAGADTKVMGMGVAADDWDQDGDLDIYFTNAGKAVLLQNQGDGAFVNGAAEAGVELNPHTVAWGAVSLDYDNDGARDLYVALMRRDQPGAFNPLFRNDGTGVFTDIGHASGADDPGPSVGVASADYDNDGWVDLVVGNYDRGYRLFRNTGLASDANRWLALRLVGSGRVNRDAIGARAIVTTSDGRVQMQDVHNGSSVGSGSTLTLHFGLGEAEIESVEILWPDGASQTVTDLAANTAYEITYDGRVNQP
ncbi:MAG TPA: FG-GAP-like repeat-containing protein [Anaerolineae bacterium]|nr:FG-GAP-like repeat-containing protein [Anaerolineae bacterium]